MATIQEIRLEKGWSQMELATYSGISYGTISRMERGLPANKSNIKRVCDTLGVKPEEVEGIVYSNPLDVARKREAARRELKRRELA